MDNRKRETTPTPNETAQGIQKPRMIRNKDIPLICDIRAMMHEIESLEKRREWQHDRMYNITRRLTGMPGGRGLPRGLDAVLASLSEMDEEYADQIAEYTRRVQKAQRILRNIQNETMRAFVMAYYADGKSKTTIMREMRMTEWGFNRARDSIEQAANMQEVIWHEKYVFLTEIPKV